MQNRGGMFRVIMLFALATLLRFIPASAAEQKPLEMGVFPYLSTRTVLELYQPVRDYLQQQLGRPVLLYTAPDFKSYVERTQQGKYDIVLTAPHFARLAQTEAGYLPIAMYSRGLHAIVVVNKDSKMSTLQNLEGKTVATPSSLALVSMIGAKMFKDMGMVPNQDIFFKDVGSHNNVVYYVMRGDAVAGITESVTLQQMPEDLRKSVRVLATYTRMPHLMYLANPNLDQSYTRKIQSLLLRFPVDSEEGKKFIQKSGFGGIKKVGEADLKAMDPYQNDLKRMLGMTIK